MPEYMRAFRRHLRDRGVFVQNVGFRRLMFQHRGSVLQEVSYQHRATSCRGKIPKNSTQFISISSLSPSADSGRSSRSVRSTNGPVSAAACRLFNAVSSELDSMVH